MQTTVQPKATKTSVTEMTQQLYKSSTKEVTFVDVPAMNFLMIDGQGDPNTSQTYKEAVEALYAVSYALKFALKNKGSSTKWVRSRVSGGQKT